MPNEIPRRFDDEDERKSRQAEGGAEASGEAAGAASWCDVGGCDTPDCDCDAPGCDCMLFLRLSTLLALVAAVVPRRASGVVLALLRLYRRRLTRFTPACPSTPSCSAYALNAVTTLGPRDGLREAARRVRACSRGAGA